MLISIWVQFGEERHDVDPSRLSYFLPLCILVSVWVIPFVVYLLIRIADENDANKLAIAEAGALDALPKYLSLSPQDSTETTVVELLRILFINPELIRHEASISSLNQMIVILRLGSRSVVRTLHELFDAQRIRDGELARQAIQPLVDMLDAGGSEKEQQTTLLVLIKLTSGNSSNAVALEDVEGDPLHRLCMVLLSATSSLELVVLLPGKNMRW